MADNTMTQDKKYNPSNILSAVFEWVSAAIVALIIVAVIFSVFFRIVNVDGESMTHTLNNGDRLLVSGFMYTPQYGDIVVIRRVNDTPLIKRIIGLPGDTMYVNPEDGIVYRNGEALEEPYIRPSSPECPTPARGIPGEVVVQEGEVYVLGDNRGGSLDSRMLGCQPTDNLVGRVIIRISPEFGKVTNGE